MDNNDRGGGGGGGKKKRRLLEIFPFITPDSLVTPNSIPTNAFQSSIFIFYY
jgi:hypothetical protein